MRAATEAHLLFAPRAGEREVAPKAQLQRRPGRDHVKSIHSRQGSAFGRQALSPRSAQSRNPPGRRYHRPVCCALAIALAAFYHVKAAVTPDGSPDAASDKQPRSLLTALTRPNAK